MKKVEDITKIVIEKNNHGSWRVKIHSENSISNEGLGGEFKEALWGLIFKSHERSWKHQPERMVEIDRKRILTMCDDFIKGLKEHMEYVFENMYEGSGKNEIA